MVELFLIVRYLCSKWTTLSNSYHLYLKQEEWNFLLYQAVVEIMILRDPNSTKMSTIYQPTPTTETRVSCRSQSMPATTHTSNQVSIQLSEGTIPYRSLPYFLPPWAKAFPISSSHLEAAPMSSLAPSSWRCVPNAPLRSWTRLWRPWTTKSTTSMTLWA